MRHDYRHSLKTILLAMAFVVSGAVTVIGLQYVDRHENKQRPVEMVR
jgi:hypothetical protein